MSLLQLIDGFNVEFKSILDSSYDGIYVADKNGETIYINIAYEKITGTDKADIIGKHINDIENNGLFSNAVTKMVLEKKITITDVVKSKKTEKHLMVTGNPVFDATGQIKFVVVNVRDITELVTLENQLLKTKVLSNKYYMELSRMKLKEGKIICNSSAMRNIIELALRVAHVDSIILIQGESGVGKELVAELVHNNSSRNSNAFVKINCGAIPENLLESELFGYESGAFSGAKKEGKAGLFEVAEGGTLLLDEISEMSTNLQVKLLRAIQDGEIRRIGGVSTIKLNVRVIATTNRDLELMVKNNEFRNDLFYRLNVVPINVPPLRERKDDIPMFIMHFMKVFNDRYNMNKKIAPNAVDAIINYSWPGNVRELENLVERIVVTTPHDIIECKDLPDSINQLCDDKDLNINRIMPLKKAVQMLEKDLICKALDYYKSKEKAAKALGVDRTTVLRKAVKYNLNH